MLHYNLLILLWVLPWSQLSFLESMQQGYPLPSTEVYREPLKGQRAVNMGSLPQVTRQIKWQERILAKCPVSGGWMPGFKREFTPILPQDLIQVIFKCCAPLFICEVTILFIPLSWWWLCRWNETTYIEHLAQSLEPRKSSMKNHDTMFTVLSSSTSSLHDFGVLRGQFRENCFLLSWG